jgi:2-polyprenyl-3-methyl-5-hydroxy-6-metoxy-1,4-benzoquinol methylase
MNTLPDYIAINKELWNAKTGHHVSSDFYRNEQFLAGMNSLNDIELALLGDVKGKRILHLQCHFGQDSLSLARMGAKVTGIDLSDAAIAKAKEQNDLLGLDAEFICSNIYDLPKVLDQQFDIVFTSYGTICWLPDLAAWAAIVSKYVQPGGYFVFADFHPVLWMFDNDFTHVQYSYFNKQTIEETESGTYADYNASINLNSVTWNHDQAEVLQNLLNTGLQLEHFSEYDYSPYACFPKVTEVAPRKYQIPGMEGKLPMVYALRMRKG